MKKVLLVLLLFICFGGDTLLKAQCFGAIHFDTSATAGTVANAGNTTYTITTTHNNDILLLSYDGWNGPGAGPVTVNGNPATHINTAITGNSGTADVYAYNATAAGSYSVVCATTGYNGGYYINMACAFYSTGGTCSIPIDSLSSDIASISCTTGGSITNTIPVAIPGSMVYATCEINEGQNTSYPISWTGAIFEGDEHTENGIDAGQAYTSAPTAGNYSFTATNSSPPNNGCGGLTLVLVVIPAPECASGMVVTPTVFNPTCNTNNGSISLAVSGGTAPYTYTWTPPVTTTANATGLSAGTYSVTIKDASCDDTTIVFTLTTSGPQANPNTSAGEKCFGECSASVTETIVGGVAPYTYSWAPGGQTTATATGLCAQTYTFTVTDINGCSGTSAVTITQPTVLTVSDVATNALCNGGTGSIAATPAGGTSPYTYSWAPSGQTSATATALNAGTYITTVTDNNGCVATATATITQPAGMTLTITGPLTLCISTNGYLKATPTGGATPYAYLWSTGATLDSALVTINATTTFSVTVTDANGCTISGTYTVTLENPPTVTVSATRTSVCSGLSTNLEAIATNVTGAFTWQPGNLSGANVTVNPTATNTYTVTAPSYCGTASATITINVNQLPATSFSTDNASGCIPLCIQFKDKTTSASGNLVEWTWTFGNGDSSTQQNPIFCYPYSGSYNVSLTTVSDSGCSSTLNVSGFITAYSSPVAIFTASPQPTTILQPTIQFTDQSTDAYGIVFWTWNFGVAGNDTLSPLQNPSYKYWDTGTFCPSEVVMNIHGCMDTAVNCIAINPVFSLYVPSGFSPNGDGKNDVFIAHGNDIKSFEMYVYDRWGTQIFHSMDINKGWDGTANGGSAVSQEDTYVYVITAYDNKNQKHSYTGSVTLIK